MGAPIVFKDEGIYPGITILQKSISDMMENRAKNRVAALSERKFSTELSGRQSAEEAILSAISEAEKMNTTPEYENDPLEFGTQKWKDFVLDRALQSGAPLNAVTKSFKGINDLYSGSMAKKSTLENKVGAKNRDYLTFINESADKAQQLLNRSPAVKEAIMSGKTPGPGVYGKSAYFVKKVLGYAPGAVQTLDTTRKDTIALLDSIRSKGVMSQKLLDFQVSAMWDPNKSEEENLVAYEIWEDKLKHHVEKAKALNKMLQENPDIIYDAKFTNFALYDNEEGEKESVKEQKNVKGEPPSEEKPVSFEELPDFKEHAGEAYEKNGKFYFCDGTKWTQVASKNKAIELVKKYRKGNK